MASRKEEKQFAKERQAAIKERKKLGFYDNLSEENKKYMRNKAIINAVWPIFRFLILFGLCFIILYPLIFMLSTAFRPNSQMNDPSIIWIPKSFTLQNIKETWRAMDFTSTVLRTLRLNVVSSLLTVVSCAITGYGFARFKFKGRNILFAIVILMIIVPPQITTIPLYMQFAYFNPLGLVKLFTGEYGNLIDSGFAMYLPAMFANGVRAGLFIFIFRQFFRGLPKELEDAAYLDGCGPIRTFIKVMIPNASSSFLTVFLFSIVWYWNDYYVSSSFFINSSTVSLMLQNLQKQLEVEIFNNQSVGTRQLIVWLESGCLLSITPILVMYIFLQKYFTEGLERSGLVG